ncbi:MAG TPA: hypothetical protein VMP42_08495 [Actinomycetota bacterium]|nr:hypothetical protein [Actinomycetota bacterium]
MRKAFRSLTAKAAIVAIASVALLGGLAFAGVPESLQTSPEEFLESVGLDPEEPEEGEEEGEFDPDPLKEGSVASEHASQTAIDVLQVIEAWHNGEFANGCEFGQAVSAAARGDTENGEDGENGDEDGEAVNPCTVGEERAAEGKAKGEESAAAGKAKGEEMSSAGKAKGEEAAAAGRARGEEASGGAGSNPGGPSQGGPPAGAGPPSSTPGGP